MGMTVHFIGAGPGAPDLITVRGRDLLARCPVCLYAGSLVPKALLAYCAPGTRLVDTAPLDCDAIEEEFIAADALGQDVTRLHPCGLSTWSAMSEQIRRLEARGIPYTVTPGIPAYAAAAASLGTRANAAEGFAEHRADARLEQFAQHAGERAAGNIRRDGRDAGDPFLDPRAERSGGAAHSVLRSGLSRGGGVPRQPAERARRARHARHAVGPASHHADRADRRAGGRAGAGRRREYADRDLYTMDFTRKFRGAVEYE